MASQVSFNKNFNLLQHLTKKSPRCFLRGTYRTNRDPDNQIPDKPVGSQTIQIQNPGIARYPVKANIVNKDDVTCTYVYLKMSWEDGQENTSLSLKRCFMPQLGNRSHWYVLDNNRWQFDAVTSPVIKGYTADKLVVPAVSGVQASQDTVTLCQGSKRSSSMSMKKAILKASRYC